MLNNIITEHNIHIELKWAIHTADEWEREWAGKVGTHAHTTVDAVA